jgi:ATP-dependent DNA helicase RecQ
MNNSLRQFCTNAFEKMLKKHNENNANTIFVLTGIEPYIDLEKFSDHIVDKETFNVEGNLTLFNRSWFGNIFSKLTGASTFQLLSHQQYASINEYLDEGYFKSRVVIIYDNLRSLYPMDKKDYLETPNLNGDEERPDMMPCYQAEQFKIGDSYFYSFKRFDDSFTKEPLFTSKKELTEINTTDNSTVNTIDVMSDPYAIDLLINNCISNDDFSKSICVKFSSKNELNKSIFETLEKVNTLFYHCDSNIYSLQEQPLKKDYIPSEESLALLKKYWGDSAQFRDINFYEEPELSHNIVPKSQGLLVDTIIQEYKNGCNGIQPNDIFITAPTGAGKSLIFQLPALYVASKGDVTIVVTPLKALMTDQVEILRRDRHYDKVEFLNSNLTLIDRDRIIESCKQGEVDILYLSPELLLSYDIHYFIGDRKLGLLIVDEAHLITTWGRDFRVDYWFLGNHINKMRKYNNYMFPLVALTATAVYGGLNDMVYDSINSLNMINPHKFIGDVRRENIEFVIDTHDDYSTGSYNKRKAEETVNIIKGIHDLDMKGIIYAPYTTQIEDLKRRCDAIDPDMTVAFHGKMNSDEQEYAYQQFKSNQCKIMICTKAFGMGIDIPDIQVVYHHAPSGLLPDYVQEIGRVARIREIQGFAALTFSKSDLRYSKQLFGISSLKKYQLQEVMSKIIRYFKSNDKKRNMLISASDFAYIFDGKDDVNQSVSTALMMIEKDYLAKVGFNVLIARPKKLFTKVYARTEEAGLERLRQNFDNCFTEIPGNNNTYHILEIDLNKIWSEHFSEMSFPQIKKDFYNHNFLRREGIYLTPQIKISITIDRSYQEVKENLSSVLYAINRTFSIFRAEGKFFSANNFEEQLATCLGNNYKIKKIAEFILETYSSYMNEDGNLENDTFLQRRINGMTPQYQVFSTNYEAKYTQLLTILSRLFEDNDKQSANRYLSINELPLLNHIRLGSLLEILNLGSFESTGGEDPKIFLRLNDPNRVEKDAKSSTYSNRILESVRKKHEVSCKLFEHFFTHYFSNEKRWDMIEDFFLGMSNDDLFDKYPGNIVNHVNILDYLKNNKNVVISDDNDLQSNDEHHRNLFKPIANKFYSRERILTIEHQTKKVKKWIVDDPMALHRTITEYNITIDKDDFKILMNKLRINHFEYYRDFMRLNILIKLKDGSEFVRAEIPYTNEPVKFYKWWKKHSNEIAMNSSEKIKLFLAVEKENPKALNKAHRAMIGK